MTDGTTSQDFLLTLACPQRPGIVHAISGFLLDHRCDIVDSRQHSERAGGRLFMRVHFHCADPATTAQDLRDSFALAVATDAMEWDLHAAADRPRLLIMVSRFGHCLNDLLYRWQAGTLKAEIPLIVSNHRDLEPLAASYGIPFEHIPLTPDTKGEAEARLLDLVESEGIDLVVLARYMQILSDELCKRLDGRAINIHHSFLPSFKGARPYHQAAERGVKLVGATAHYVTPDLDEGPIIEQEVIRVDHSLAAEDLAAVGRDAECLALAHAVQWHIERRVLRNGSRTVVFR